MFKEFLTFYEVYLFGIITFVLISWAFYRLFLYKAFNCVSFFKTGVVFLYTIFGSFIFIFYPAKIFDWKTELIVSFVAALICFGIIEIVTFVCLLKSLGRNVKKLSKSLQEFDEKYKK